MMRGLYVLHIVAYMELPHYPTFRFAQYAYNCGVRTCVRVCVRVCLSLHVFVIYLYNILVHLDRGSTVQLRKCWVSTKSTVSHTRQMYAK